MTASTTVRGSPVWPWRALWATILVVGIVLKALQSPLYAFGTLDDDELMVRMAQGFLHGHWSSTWASTGLATLVKPVGFPLFLAGAHFLPWSPLVTVYLMAVAGAVLAAWSWRRLSGSRAQATAVLAVLVYNPIAFTIESQRIYRNIFIDAVATLAIGLSFVIAAELEVRRRGPARRAEGGGAVPVHRRRRTGPGPVRRIVPFALALGIGLLVGMTAITKPTWQWLPFAIAAPLAYPLVRRLRSGGRRAGVVLRVALACLLVVVGAWGVVQTVKVMNQRTYGVSLVEDFSTGGLARTWKAWASVEAGPPEHGVQITDAMRRAVYRVSPAAAEMAPYLESPQDFWKSIDCSSSVHICDESGNWFEWDLQSAAASTGKVNSVLEFQQFFNRVADEIEHACATGALRCTSSPVLATGLPPLDRIPLGTLATDTAGGMWRMVDGPLPMGPPGGPRPTAAQYRLWSSVVPGMAPIGQVSRGTTPTGVYPVLRVLNWVYRLVNVALLALVALGLVAWGLDRTVWRRRRRVRGDPAAGVAAALFLVSWAVGMGLLAVFEAGRAWPGYVSALYWTDFVTPAELFLVLGAVAAWPVLRGTLGGRRAERGEDRDDPVPAGGEVPPPEEVPTVGGPSGGRSATTVDAVLGSP